MKNNSIYSHCEEIFTGRRSYKMLIYLVHLNCLCATVALSNLIEIVYMCKSKHDFFRYIYSLLNVITQVCVESK